ncbi:L,D-transpeptidase family protein [Pseudooceanicola sp.]|uniref:L,D-transpeptidase family protein n=1 Tax=Pseudooceanicola sp. TaxID=1914328 RepID=UPI0026383400|nr:L,D-transpeptidase family protein [Pseudooceanicola sp.]MDF1855787.1 L,D-transpeptidase family protein [Pseudooceanicola sp.]
MPARPLHTLRFTVAALCATAMLSLGAPAQAQVTAFKQAVAESIAGSGAVARYYRQRDFAPIWTGADDAGRARRSALFEAFSLAGLHNLPTSKFDSADLRARMAAAKTPRDMGKLDVALTRLFLEFGRDLQTGILTPSEVVKDIHRVVPLRDASFYLDGITSPDPRAFVRALVPATGEYTRLLKTKLDLQGQLAHGGWGPAVPAKSLKPGAEGRAVVALRNRLIAMGYLAANPRMTYDGAMQAAVMEFQADHGLEQDGVAGAGTMDEINVPMEDRLKSVIVAMERERWLNRPRGDRHVLVNLADFHARIVDFDQVTFQTRSVIGQNTNGRRSPEFSDVMEHMIINPTWNVPRSIATKEYLPALKRNPFSNSHLRVINSRGQVVDRGSVDFSNYSEKNFPFDLKQPPSNSNALGLVKFMFPNKYNIYLHDTPSKSLFARESRAFSHGCIRLADPFDFAYALLAVQEADPEPFFQSILRTRRETLVPLEQPIQVHLIYRTAVTQAKGRINFRRDVYGRDAAIWEALARAGVSLNSVQG